MGYDTKPRKMRRPARYKAIADPIVHGGGSHFAQAPVAGATIGYIAGRACQHLRPLEYFPNKQSLVTGTSQVIETVPDNSPCHPSDLR
jgi:hypothetical protein